MRKFLIGIAAFAVALPAQAALPVGTKALVSEGQTAIAGETILADLTGDDPSRSYRAN